MEKGNKKLFKKTCYEKKNNHLTTTYIEHKHKNTGTSILIDLGNLKNIIIKTFFWPVF